MSEDAVGFALSGAHYLVDGTVGVTPGKIPGTRFAFETSAGFNIIPHSVLPQN